MDYLVNLFNQIEQYLDLKLVLIIIISSYWVKTNLKDVLPNITDAHKILIWCLILTLFYILILKVTGIFKVEDTFNYVITYTFATSIYEIALKPFEDWINNKLNNKE